jgi:murein DD-endopeptidase MepM/ murein hydrolase activator NlpD
MEKIKIPFAGKYPMTQDYGVKVSYMRAGIHTGIDWGLPKGTPLLACFAGKVIKAARWQLTGYGKEIQIQRADGLIAQYGHCSEILCEVGNEIETGTILGKSGNTGFVISLGGGGYHLHFGTMIKAAWFDPKKVLDGMSLPLDFKGTEIKQPEPVKIPVKNEDQEPGPEQIHTVEKGDTLSKLAKAYLGNGNLWPQIFEINKDTLINPNKLKIGQKIKIPNVKK